MTFNDSLNVYFQNVFSLRSNIIESSLQVLDNNYDLLFFTETILNPDINERE